MSQIDARLEALDTAIRAMTHQKSLNGGLDTALAVLELLGCPNNSNAEDISLTKLHLPNSERFDHWFHPHPFFKSDRSCFELFDSHEIPLQAKFYWLKKKSKSAISGGVHFSPNWEDSEYTRVDGYKIGLDFFLSPTAESLLVVLSDRGNLRIVELSEQLRVTQIEIFNAWIDAVDSQSVEILHTTLWKSFQLQAVNEKFFTGIANAYTELIQHFDSNVSVFDEESSKQFANRLIGRLLFCWFLRKRKILDESQGYFTLGDLDSTEYYRSRLVPLFFLTLNVPIANRAEKTATYLNLPKSYLPRTVADEITIDLKTPYLNGGLFEAHENDYLGSKELCFPSGFFSRLFDHFESYNFTTDESSPEYEQVAIDPEMLGKVFESLLATFIDTSGSIERSARGTFYTPREIVSRICRETLRDSLKTRFPDSQKVRDSIDALIDTSTANWVISGPNSKRDLLKGNENEILKALVSITVLDPACGSGAFPIGMLNEIVRLHQRLVPGVDTYQVKIDYLKNSIFGVDIEPIAIEICRLRAWLSVLVDSPRGLVFEPLPNLDFKFVAADSLTVLPDENTQTLWGNSELESQLGVIREQYFTANDSKKKAKLKAAYEKQLSESKDPFQNSDRDSLIKTFNPFDSSTHSSFFDPPLFFGRAQFDIVIGNPPYVDSEMMTSKFPKFRNYLKEHYKSTTGNWDLFIPFIERGIELTAPNGSLSFVVKNNLYGARYADAIRQIMMKQNIVELQEFNTVKVFDDADVLPTVFRLSKNNIKNPVRISLMETVSTARVVHEIDPKRFYETSNWIPFLSDDESRSILQKMDSASRLNNLGFKIGASATVGEAYELKEFVEEKEVPNQKYKKLINTGSIDRYLSLWGKKPTKYLKDNYEFPVVANTNIQKINWARYEQSDSKKVIITGIRSLEAFLDIEGEYLAGKSTTIMYFPHDPDIRTLKIATMLLNSRPISFWFFKTFSAGGMTTGGGSISPKDLALIPVPEMSEKDKIELEKLYDIYVSTLREEDFEAIDLRVSQMFNLTEKEYEFAMNNVNIRIK